MTDHPTETVDERHPFRGVWGGEGVCRIRVYEAPDHVPVVVISDLPDNPDTSTTNLIEYLAYEAIRAHLPNRLEETEPAIVLHHFPPGTTKPRTVRGHVSRVSFATKRPRMEWLGGVMRVRFGEPSWADVGAEELARLVGNDPVAET
jgi:hypothetical protein